LPPLLSTRSGLRRSITQTFLTLHLKKLTAQDKLVQILLFPVQLSAILLIQSVLAHKKDGRYMNLSQNVNKEQVPGAHSIA
jgi:hypothetical protein